MPTKQINMHGKLYDLLDEVERNKEFAQIRAQEIRDDGQVAFLNPRKRKGQETVYYIYIADKTIRKKRESKIKSEVEAELIEIADEQVQEAIENLEKNLKICPICGEGFEPKNSRHIYDTKECAKEAKKLRKLKIK